MSGARTAGSAAVCKGVESNSVCNHTSDNKIGRPRSGSTICPSRYDTKRYKILLPINHKNPTLSIKLDISISLKKLFNIRKSSPISYSLDLIAAAACEPEANERGSSLISRGLHYRGLQSLFLTKRKELWLCANGRFRMRSGMRKELWLCANGNILGCAVIWCKELWLCANG